MAIRRQEAPRGSGRKGTFGVKTKEDIVNDIVKETSARIPQISNYNAGGVFRLFVEVIALFVHKGYAYLDAFLPNVFVHRAGGAYLDEHAAQLGLKRIPERRAQGFVVFSRHKTADNIVIAKGKAVSSKADYLGTACRYFVSEETILPEGSSSVSVPVTAEYSGAVYNLPALRITQAATPISGIDAVSNTADWLSLPGLDTESDEGLRLRCLAQWKGLNGANTAAYISWARKVAGIGSALPLATARGLGTVDLIITGTGNTSPSPELLAAVQREVDAEKPVGTDAVVKAPLEVTINPALRVYSVCGLQADEEEVRGLIDAFFREVSVGEDYESSKLSALVFTAKNIKKVEVLSCESAEILAFQIARLGTLTLEVLDGSEF